jgi:hypothetical protein
MRASEPRIDIVRNGKTLQYVRAFAALERVESESALKNPTVARARFILTLGVVARKPNAPLLSRRFCSLYDKEVVGERSLCALNPCTC